MAKHGGFPKGMGGGMPNMNNLMKQAQKMQQDIARVKEELADKTVEVSAGGGAIKIVATCEKVIKEIKIDPQVVDPDDVEMFEDLIVAAVNEALKLADEISEKELSKVTGGMGNMPGLF